MAPISPAALHILLALVEQPRHGYGITIEVERLSEDRYKLGPGTLYDNLEKLITKGLVEKTDGPRDADARRKAYYRLTDHGRKALASEVARLDKLFREARPLLGLGAGEGA